MYDSCCKVPLLIKPPGFAGGTHSDGRGLVREEIVNTLDLYGTLLDAAGDTGWQQPHIEARSLMPLLTGPGHNAWENGTYSIMPTVGRTSDPSRNLTMLRRDDLKLMRLARGEEEPLYELYDMNDEVVEVRNVFDAHTARCLHRRGTAYCDIIGTLRAELDAWCRHQAAKYPDEVLSYAKT